MRDYGRVAALYLIGVVVALPGGVLVLLSVARLAYASSLLQPAFTFLFWHVPPPLQAAWPYLQDSGPNPMALPTAVPIVLGFILMFIGRSIINIGRAYYADISAVAETLRRSRMEERKGGGYRRQSIGNMFAGGSINVEQHIVEAARRLQKPDSEFWRKPVLLVVTGVVAIILAAEIMNVMGIGQ
jgi:hypothetical protein